jgi:hypothetical protein
MTSATEKYVVEEPEAERNFGGEELFRNIILIRL